ncbi:MAG: MFS transporter [Betaproteobacteria bacterium]|nr:MFS transporter [Betaproteobacteria bacterium]
MKPIWIAMLIVVVTMLGMRGSKITVSLMSLELGASQFLVGVIVALYSLLPMFLGLYAGKLTDRLGVRLPIICGSIGIAIGLLIPGLLPKLPSLFVSAAAIGAAHIFYNVSIQNLIGLMSPREDRARNFSNFAMMMAISGFLGPLLSGVLIDGFGHANTYLFLMLGPLTGVAIMLALPKFAANLRGSAGKTKGGEDDGIKLSGFGLLSNKPLRRVLIMSGILMTGLDLLHFYMPIYCHSIGLSASKIGVIMAAFSAAAFVVRLWMPAIVKRYGERNVLSFALGIATVTYLIIPWVSSVPLLILITFTLGLGMGCGQPLIMMMIYNRAPEGQSGEALGLRQTINHFTHMAVPLAFGAIGSAFGVWPVFLINALMLGGSGYLSHRR